MPARLPAPIRIGCSGWNYRHWRGVFYPEKLSQRLWFDHYARIFDTVEINNSFYRLPTADTFARWAEQAPPGFCYAVKANRFLTQAKKLKDCAEPLARMMTPTRHLVPALGPILFQLPPSLQRNLPRLEEFLALLPTDVTSVFEFRHPSWYVVDTLHLLDRYSAAFCARDMPGSASPRWSAGRAAYVRFHGTDGKYHGRYEAAALEDWASWMREQTGAGRTVWAFFNNDIAGHAIADAAALRSIVASA